MKTYPTSVSRTLDPNNKALVTVVGQHDQQLSDADVDLIQDLQDLKRTRLLSDSQVTSGGLTYAPMQFNPFIANTFFVPAFDILFNGEVVTIAGNNSADVTTNRVAVPQPPFWATASDGEDARVYVAFVEMWYQALNPTTGSGYYVDPQTGLKYFYPFGGLNPDPSNATSIPDDSIDPFDANLTTVRGTIQWRISVQRLSLNYNFSQHAFGLENDPNATFVALGQGNATQPLAGLFFTNMGSVTGDAGVWRAGDGNVNNGLGTMDGYVYAFPLAVAFQYNSGAYDIVNNVFGCADPSTPGSGLLASRTSGRFDSRLADQLFADQVVDLRHTVKLDGWDSDALIRQGWADLVMGTTKQAIGRGESPGNKTEALGSLLSYYVSMSPVPIANTKTVGAWPQLTVGNLPVNFGFANGFSSDNRTFFTALLVTTNQKSVGTPGSPWIKGDAFSISLPQSAGATFESVTVTALVGGTVKTPAALLQGQVQINVGLTSATVVFVNDLPPAFAPGDNAISVVIGVVFAPGTTDLQKVPVTVNGGSLFDNLSGKQLPVYGISEYQVQTQQTALQASQVWAINPEFSDILFGVKIWLQIAGNSSSITQSVVAGAPISTVVINRIAINGNVNGLYATRAWDLATGNFYNISGRVMKGNQHTLIIQGAIPTTSTLVVSMLAQDTAQLAYNAPVKGVTAVEETVLIGNYTSDAQFTMDSRVSLVSTSFDSVANASTALFAANGCTIEGIAGDDAQRLVWILDNSGNLNGTTVTSANISNGIASVVVPGIDLTTAQFFFVAAINPAFDPNSSLIVSLQYIPYQGEGILNRDYEFVHAEDECLITTNGTGAAPIAGLSDVFPYNRELPIVVSLPAQASWISAESSMINEPLATFFDSNYVAMRQNNVEHTFLAPMHVNDFIPPVNRDIRKKIRFITAGGRGFSQATPHIGFAIATPSPRTVLGQNLQSTIAPITLYVDNVNGNDINSGLAQDQAKASIGAAIAVLPPVLRHPCVLILLGTGSAYNIGLLKNSMDVVALGDGDIRSAKQYCLANLSRVIHDEGRLVISREPNATTLVSIDATGFSGFGDGPTSAFYLDTSRVIFNGIEFKGFTNPAITAYNSDVDFVDCKFTNNLQAGAYVGCDVVILDRGTTTMPDSGIGHVCTQSNLTASAHNLAIGSGLPGAFFVATRNSTLNLSKHGTGSSEETAIAATSVVAEADLNSNISVTPDFQTNGAADLTANSVLSRTVTVDPFLGGVAKDPSSSVVSQLG